MNIEKIDTEKFAETLLKEIAKRGIDSLSARDYQTLMIKCFVDSGYLNIDQNIPVSLSKDLKITPTKIKNLLTECYIKYDFDRQLSEEDLKSMADTHKTTKKDLEDGFIVFHIISPVKQLEVIDFFEQNQIAPEYGNNRSIIKVPYAFILEDMKVEFLQEVDNKLKEKEKVQLQTKNNQKQFIETAFNYLGENIIQPAVTSFVTVITNKYS